MCVGCRWKGNRLVCGQCKKAHADTSVQAPDVERASRHEPLAEKEGAGLFARCRITVHSRRKRLADPDGISCKAVLDGLGKAGVFADDNASIISEVRYSQELAKEDETVIIVEEIL